MFVGPTNLQRSTMELIERCRQVLERIHTEDAVTQRPSEEWIIAQAGRYGFTLEWTP